LQPATEPNSLKVTLCLGSQTFQKSLAAALMQRGMLARVLSFGPDIEILEPDGAGNLKLLRKYTHTRTVNRFLWGGWKRLPGSNHSRTLPVVVVAAYADWLGSKWVPSGDIFHCWAGTCFASLRAAKKRGAITMLESPSMHTRDWQKSVLEECEACGVRSIDCRSILPEPLMRRMEREYHRGDFIVVPSAVARESFERAGLRGKAIVVNAGVDHNFFTPPTMPRPPEIFRVCYSGRVEIAKGVVYLLQAWNQLGLSNAELVIIGDVAPEMAAFVRRYALPNVRFTGFVPVDQLARWYRESNLFAFPSSNEGLARVLFEAMASGLPVIATKSSGAEDCVTPGEDGTIVPIRDVDALAEAILWHFQNREATATMGRAARRKIEQQFTVAHYEQRMIQVYRSVIQR